MTSVAVSTVRRRAGRKDLRQPGRAPRWHLAACWRALESVADQLGDPPRYHRYVQLAAGREDLPSPSTVRQRLGSWPHIAAELQGRHAAPEPGERTLDGTRGSAPRNRTATRSQRRAGAADAVRRVPSRVTVRVLSHIAAHPGASAATVKRSTGIRHRSQISELLSRLEREGMLTKQRNGSANAWTLTRRGHGLLRQLPEDVYA